MRRRTRCQHITASDIFHCQFYGSVRPVSQCSCLSDKFQISIGVTALKKTTCAVSMPKSTHLLQSTASVEAEVVTPAWLCSEQGLQRGSTIVAAHLSSVTVQDDQHKVCWAPQDPKTPPVELPDGRSFQVRGAWCDLYEAICEAKHLIYITGWSIYDRITLVRDPAKPTLPSQWPTLGEDGSVIRWILPSSTSGVSRAGHLLCQL